MKPAAIGVVAAVLTIGAVSYTGFRAAIRAGEFTTLTPVFDGTCTDVAGFPGAEDMAIDRARGVVFVSSDDRRASQAAAKAGQAGPRGAIFRLDLADPTAAAERVDLTGGVPAAFHPHGLGLWVGPDGRRVLMVANHPHGFETYEGTTVEIYDVGEDGALAHRRSVAVPGLTRINDVLPTGPDGFYATSESDHARGGFGETWANFVGTDLTGSVWHVEGSAGRRLADGIGFANSLALSPDGRTLYATGTTSRGLYVFARDPATNAITLRDKAFIGTGVDNLDVEPDGRIWVAAHPKLMTFAFGHAVDGRPAPSQVLIVEPAADGRGGEVDQVYLQTGEPEGSTPGFSGASVAIRSGETMLLGSVFEPTVRVCRLPTVWKQSESHPAQRLLDVARDERLKAEEKARDDAAGPPPPP